MTTRVYVGRLPYRAKERDLEDFFHKYGRLRDIIIKNGFAFVEFDDARDAEDAAYYMNGKELCGDRVIVELTKRPPRGRDAYRTTGTRYLADRYGRNGGGGGGRGFSRSPRRRENTSYPTQTRFRVIVENLSSRVSWQDLKDFMRSAGGDVCYSDAHRIHKNEGVVCFTNQADMRRALDKLDGKELGGRKIKLMDGSGRTGSRSRSSSGSSSVSRSRSRSRSNVGNKRGTNTRSRSPHSRSPSGSRSADKKKKPDRRSPTHSRTPSASRSPESRSTSRSASRDRSRSPKANGKN